MNVDKGLWTDQMWQLWDCCFSVCLFKCNWNWWSRDQKPTCLKNIMLLWPLSHVWLFAIPWTVARQTLSMEFSRQEYWSGLSFPSPGHLPNPGVKPTSPTFQMDSSSLNHQGSPENIKLGQLCEFSSNLLKSCLCNYSLSNEMIFPLWKHSQLWHGLMVFSKILDNNH